MSYKTFIGAVLLAGFSLLCGSAAQVYALVPDAPTVTFSANPSSLTSGGYTTLTWTSTNATSCSASGFGSGWSGPKTIQGAQPAVGPFYETVTLSLACEGSGGLTTKTVVVSMPTGTQPPSSSAPAPTVTLTATPNTLTTGEYTTLTWTSTNATSCTASGYSNGWSGPKTTQGAQPAVGPLNDTYTLQLTCTGAGGSKTASVVINYTPSNTPSGPVSTPSTPSTPTPSTSCVNLQVTLDIGSRGDDVVKLQNFLRAKGLLTAQASGYFGTLTKNAVIAFQRENNLSPVGVVGPLTRAKIRLLTCGDAGTPTNPTTPSTPSSPLAIPSVNLKINGSNGPVTLTTGQTVVMSWESVNATSCRVGAPINSAAALSSTGGAGATFGPDSPYYPRSSAITYTITCTNRAGTASDSVVVNPSVATPPPPTSSNLSVNLTVNGSDVSVSVPYGNPVTLVWSAPNATSCTLGVFGSDTAVQLATSGTLTYTLNTSYYPGNGATFRVACSNSAQSGSSSVIVTMTGKPDAVSVDIKANGGDAPITVASGNAVSITWAAQPSNSAYMSCVGSGSGVGANGIDASLWNGGKTYSGLMTAHPVQTTTYTITCSAPEGVATDSVTVNVQGGAVQAPTVTLTASPTTVMSGQSSTLTWTSTNTTGCTASGAWAGARPISGTVSTGALTAQSNTFSILCFGTGGSVVANAQVNTTQSTAPSVSLIATPSSVTSGQSSTLSWTSLNTTNCTASGNWSGSKTVSGSEQTNPLTASATYTLTCAGTTGTAYSTAVVSIGTSDPTVTISASPTVAAAGLTTNITWSSTNATSCSASGSWSGSKATSGTQVSGPLVVGANTFTISCSGASRTVSATVVVSGTNTQVSTKFVIGSWVFVKADVNARPNPSINSTPASLHPIDDLGSVVDGPISADGFTWWKIDYVTGVDGWTVEDNLGLGGVSFTPVSKIFYFTASPSSITNGQSTTLSWYANATNCGVFQNATDQLAIGGGYMPGVASGYPGVTSITVSPASTWTYTLKCYKDFGAYSQGSPTVTQPITVTVSDGPAPTISSFSVAPSVFTSGATTNLSWSASANSCKIFQETYQRGSVPAVSQVITSGNAISGTLSVSPKTLGTYTLVCERNRQTVSRSVAVTADLPNDPSHDTTPSQGVVTLNLKVNGSTGTNNIVPVVQGNDVVISWDSQFSSSMAGGISTCSMGAGSQDLGGTMLNGSATLTKTHQFYPKADQMMNLTMTCMGTDSTFKTYSATKDIMVKLVQQ